MAADHPDGFVASNAQRDPATHQVVDGNGAGFLV